MFKVGDTVRIRSDLIVNKQYGNDKFIEPMQKYLGKESTISEVIGGGKYLLTICLDDFPWGWTEDMLEGAKEMYIAYDTNTGKLLHSCKLLHSGEQYIFTREELLEVANKVETPIDSYVIYEIADTPTKYFCVDLEEI